MILLKTENKNAKNPYTGNETKIRIPVIFVVSFETYKTIHGEELSPTIFSIYIINLLVDHTLSYKKLY